MLATRHLTLETLDSSFPAESYDVIVNFTSKRFSVTSRA